MPTKINFKSKLVDLILMSVFNAFYKNVMALTLIEKKHIHEFFDCTARSFHDHMVEILTAVYTQ